VCTAERRADLETKLLAAAGRSKSREKGEIVKPRASGTHSYPHVGDAGRKRAPTWTHCCLKSVTHIAFYDRLRKLV
jgi:hypothetical protein